MIWKEIREMMVEGRKEREDTKGCWEVIMKVLEEMMREMKMKEEKWERKWEAMEKRMEKLEEKVVKKEEGGEGEGWKELRRRVVKLEEKGTGITRSKMKGGVERVKRIERLLEKEKVKTKRNLVFKEIKEEMGNTRKGIIKIGRKIGMEIEIEEVRSIKTSREKRGEMTIVKVRSEEKRRKLKDTGKKEGVKRKRDMDR